MWGATTDFFVYQLALPERVDDNYIQVISMMQYEADATAVWQGSQEADNWQHIRNPRGLGLDDRLFPHFIQTREETDHRWRLAYKLATEPTVINSRSIMELMMQVRAARLWSEVRPNDKAAHQQYADLLYYAIKVGDKYDASVKPAK